MANTPHNQDPNRAPGSPGGQPPKAKKPESSPGDFQEIDPNLLGSGEFSELDPKLLESADALPIDPRLLESGEHDPGDFRERLQQQPDAKRPPDSAEVQYTTPPPVGDPGSFDGGISYGAMPQPTDIPTAGLSKIPSSGDSGSGIDWAPPSHADSGQGSSFAIPTAQPASGSGSNLGISSEHLSIPSEDAGSAEFPIPSGTPISSDLQMSDANRPTSAQDSSGTLEPIAPAAGWLDSMEQPMETPPAETSPAAAEAIESSDIFGGGPVPRATAADQSDVIGATAFKKGGPLESNESGRTSDVALSFNRPQGSSSNLPVADEVLEAEAIAEHPSSLFSNPPAAGLPFDSAKLADAPPLPEASEPVEVPEFGKTPEQGNDASSILADLAEADEHGTKDSSAVKLESPGVERTFSSDQGEGTEFDLTINDALPHELIAEAASDHGPEEWESLPGPEMFANDKTAHDVDLEKSPRPVRIEHDWAADVPPGPASQSSIFSDRTPARDQPLPGDGSEVQLANTPTPGPSDSSVEFSDQPEAELESSESAVFDRSNPANQPPGERPKSKHSVSEFELPAAQGAADAAAMDWSQTHEVDVPPRGRVPRAEDSSILSRETITQQELEKEGTLPETRHAAPLPQDAKGSPAPPKPGRQIRKAKPSSHGERKLSDPSVEIDWMASSGSAEAAPMGAGDSTVGAVDTAGGGAAHTRTAAGRPEKRAMAGTGSTRGAWIGGVIVGMVVAGGGFAGAYFGGFIPNSKGTGQKAITNPGQQGANTNTAASGTPGAADAAAALRAGDAAKARQIALALNDSTPAGKALTGEASLFALVQEKGTAIAADNPDLAAARENLQAVVNDPTATTAEGKQAAVKAAVQLGISHEIAGDRAAAKKVYEEAKAKFPDFADTFDAALDRLAVTRTSESTSLRLPTLDARQLLFAITLLQSNSRAGEAEAGVYFWKAVNKATGERYAEAIEEIKKARAAHLKQAKAKAGIGLNPLSDPLEQMFPRCCDDLKTYWELRGAIYSNKAVADIYKREGAQKAFATLDAAQVRAAKALADLKSA
ncbi:MAG TPA: hypothetical protein VLM40_15025, partial [Gemmata sp.]|nr:hypothetical protein [Gemmata sp.]